MLRRRQLAKKVVYFKVVMTLKHVKTHASVSPMITTRLSLAAEA